MPQTDSATPGKLEIRKYQNRRYYDATRSKAVTLEEIHQLIRDGHEIHVTDAKTGEDITGQVLAQIILEMDTPKLEVFPVALLHRLIQSNETLMRDFVDKYFSQALMLFLESRRKFEEQMRGAMGLAGAADWTRMMSSGFVPPFWTPSSTPPKAEPQTATAPPPQPEKDLRHVVDELKAQMASLQQQLAQRKQPRKKPVKE